MFQQESDAPVAPPMAPDTDPAGGLSPEAIAILGPDVVAALSDPEVAQAIVEDLRDMLGLGDGEEDNEQGGMDGYDQDSMVDASGMTPGGPVEAPSQPMPPMSYGETPGGPDGGPSAMLSPDVPRQGPPQGPPSGLRAAGGGGGFRGR